MIYEIEYLIWILPAIYIAAMAKMASQLVYQNDSFSDEALGTLAARTALSIGASFTTALQRSFLMKHWKGSILIKGVTAGEGPFAIALGPGGASAAEATQAINEGNTVGPSDITQLRTQDNALNIFQKTLLYLKPVGGPAPTEWYLTWDMSLGRGFPGLEGQGWTTWVFNLDGSALITGAVANGTSQIQGVWLQ